MEREKNDELRVRSIAFSHGGHIPAKYTCEGKNVNPPLEISGCPTETKSLALIVEDPDAPKGVYDHWVVWNIPPNDAIPEDSRPGVGGTNSFGNTDYAGPCPPSGSHRYFFRVYALDTELDIPSGSDKKVLQEAIKEHVVASGELMAHYQKRK
ncbi:MAG TPA: YbhB/YbcL family Raf kinase inhibitor-like protein [Chitinophagaceae bacterium]